MNISYIIPLLNEEDTIQRCLNAIMAQIQYSDEIIVVDNGSTDKSLDIIRTIQNISLVYFAKGTIGAVRNAGATIARGQLLAFIDADCVICPGWRDNVINTLNKTRFIATGSKVAVPDDAVWIEKAWYSQRDNKCSRASYINSGNFIILRSVFEKMGGFSEDLITGEDSELGWRINKAGYTIFNNPEIKTIHLGNPKNLKDFYKKEKWHALGMMGTFNISCFDKPFIMTMLFAISNFIAMIILALSIMRGRFYFGIIAAIISTGWIPLITVCYRTIQFGNTTYFLHLVCLYWIYFIARANAFYGLILGKFKNPI